MREKSPEQRCADLLSIRNPGREIVHDPDDQVYRAWRVENGRPTPPSVSETETSRLDVVLRDALYEMRDRGLLPDRSPETGPGLG